jgi:glycosyltransferase involved in cell wall biosynthesis
VRQWFERQLGPVRKQVDFLGVLNQKELDDAFRRAWVVIVPSRWDTFPQVVLEAMARGKAIVASPHGGTPEALNGTGNAIADPATPAFVEAVLHFLRNSETRAQAGEDGRRVSAQRFGPRVVTDLYISTIAGLLGSDAA